MLKSPRALLAALLALVNPARSADLSSRSLPLREVADVALPGRPTRLDYQSLDPAAHRLFISHMGDDNVIVFDTRTRKVVGTVGDIGTPTGVLAVPEENTVFASATRTDEIVAFDERTLRITDRYPADGFPDGMAYVPGLRKLFVSNEAGGADTVIDLAARRKIGAIALGGEVGNTHYDPLSDRIWVAVQTLDQLVAIDPRTDSIVGRYPLAGAQGDHGFYLDSSRKRAYVSCEDNNILLVVDLTSLRVIQSFKVGDGPDVLAFDPGLGRLYVATESGIVSAFQAVPGGLTELGAGFVGDNAHTVAVDPTTHLVYFPLKDVGGRPVLRIMAPVTSPGSP